VGRDGGSSGEARKGAARERERERGRFSEWVRIRLAYRGIPFFAFQFFQVESAPSFLFW
jgi:hypothetical protein